MFLTDVVMPSTSGRELAERVWQLEPSLPVLYMSANPYGMLDPMPATASFLAKPFDAAALLAAVRKAMRAGDAASGARADPRLEVWPPERRLPTPSLTTSEQGTSR